MDTDEHRFSGLNSGLALLRFGSQSGERLLDVETRGFRWFLSVFFCAHLWLTRAAPLTYARQSKWLPMKPRAPHSPHSRFRVSSTPPTVPKWHS